MAENMVTLSDDNFDQEVLNSPIPVLVDFWAAWCGPCRMVAPILDKIAEEFKGQMKFAKLNVDENQKIPQKYGIRSIPTMIIFKNGQIREQMIGALPENKIKDKVKASL